jgi:choline dehydrogenase-like flavoprotein
VWVDAESLEDEIVLSEVAVVGAGPAGIVAALDLARNGIDVVLIESGGRRFRGRTQKLGDAHSFDEARHAPMRECTRRQLGGASVIWGGRCVPYDPIDFESRRHVPNSQWPVRYDEIEGYFERTCDYLRCGRAVFDISEIEGITQRSIVPGLPDGDVLSSSLERWSLPTNFGAEYGKALESHSRIRVVAGLTCTEIDVDASGRRVTGLQCRRLSSAGTIRVEARAYVIACGGIEGTRLLLASNRVHRDGIGNHADHLGRYYMGHISGRIAHVHFTTPPKQTVYGFDRDVDGTYVRRRLSFSPEFQREKELLNIVAFPANPDIGDPVHGNGVLSFAYLALTSPLGRFFASEAIRKSAAGASRERHVLQHIRNMLLDPWRTLHFVPTFGYQRFVAHRKVPGFYQYSHGNTYPLHYHGEQVPNPDSRVTLTDTVDELGMPRLNIDLRYTDQDVDYVIRAHRHWDEYLRAHGVGYLEYMAEDPEASVWEQATDGFHQAGTTRMSATPGEGVVDGQCRVHGIDNLYVASSSNFVTSSQANSTFMIVAFALRLADHLRATTLKERPATG